MPVRNLTLIAVAVLVVLLFMSVFVVREDQTAIRFRFGEIVQSDYGPGLHFKIPFINNVRHFDARIQTLDAEPERFLTLEQKNLIVDSFVKWRISDSETFYTAVAGSAFRANQRLDQIIKNGMRSEFSRRDLNQVVSGDRTQIMDILSDTAREEARRFGIDVVDVRIRRIDLPEEVSESVFARMRSEREQLARQLRSEGRQAAEFIRASADRTRIEELARAYETAEIIRGEGDAEAAAIYAEAFGRDIDFFSFHRSLSAYRHSFATQDDLLVLQPRDSEFFQYFSNPSATVETIPVAPVAASERRPPAVTTAEPR